MLIIYIGVYIINIKNAVNQASVVYISIRRKRADFGPNTFQSSSVVANQRHVVFVVKNHDSTETKNVYIISVVKSRNDVQLIRQKLYLKIIIIIKTIIN